MPRRGDGPVSGLVLAAGSSSRLGRPKQLLRHGTATLLDRTLANAREFRFDQLVCALGAEANEIRGAVDLHGVDVVENHRRGEGCASSIAAAMAALDPRCEVLVLLLGDQPGVTAVAVAALLAGRDDAAVAVCRYDDGRGHPFAFARSVFGELRALHGDKAVWKLLARHAGEVAEVAEVAVAGPVPRDVDTWEDYALMLAQAPAP